MNTLLAKIGNDVYRCRHFLSMFCVPVFRIGKYFLRIWFRLGNYLSTDSAAESFVSTEKK
jgi:hypothetical protein